jgi:hypothetical protein
MTPLHNLVKSALLPICLAATESGRAKKATPQDEERKKKVAASIKEAKDRHSVSSNYAAFLAEVIAAVDPSLVGMEFGEQRQTLPLFSIIRDKDDGAGGDLYITIHGAKARVIDKSAEEFEADGWKIIYASEIEVEEFLDGLTAEGLRDILSLDEFQAALAPLFEETTELVTVAVNEPPETTEPPF